VLAVLSCPACDDPQRHQDRHLLPQYAQQRLELGPILDWLLGRGVGRGAGPRRLLGVEGRGRRGAGAGVLCGQIRHGWLDCVSLVDEVCVGSESRVEQSGVEGAEWWGS
jgi:hypothetical protein